MDASLRSEHDRSILALYVANEKNTGYVQRLRTHLAPFVRTQKPEDVIWDISMTPVGVDTLAYFEQQLQRTRAAVLLLDADFFASSFILDQALPLLFKAVEQGTLRIFPVLVGPCQLELYPEIACYYPAHNSFRPLWVTAPQRREEWWAQVAQTIYTATFVSDEQNGKRLSHGEKIASEQKANVRPRK